MSVAPSLLCLNMRREHFDFAAAPPPPLGGVLEALERARDEGWRVMHAHSMLARVPGRGFGALARFEPRTEEPVFALSGVSAFSEPKLVEAARARRPACMHLVGAIFARAGLASVFAAQEGQLIVDIIAEACVTPAVEAVAAEHVLQLAREEATTRVIGRAPAFRVQGENIICLESRRT